MLTIDKVKGIAIHEYVDQMGIKHIDKTNLKAPITRGFDINWKPYDENNLIGIFDGEAITLDDIE